MHHLVRNRLKLSFVLSLLFCHQPAGAGGDWSGFRRLEIPFVDATHPFKAGFEEESHQVQQTGSLSAFVNSPVGLAKPPFVIMLHGCAGLNQYTSVGLQDWSSWFKKNGYGSVAVDSFENRGVKKVCGHPDAKWAKRRVDDIYATAKYLVDKGLADPNRIYVIGQSNGGRAALDAVSTENDGRSPQLAGAISLYPQCGDDRLTNFYRPLLVISAENDTVNKALACRRLERDGRLGEEPKVVVIPNATHGFDVNVPPRYDSTLNLHLEFNQTALDQTHNEVLNFLSRRSAASSSTKSSQPSSRSVRSER